MRTNILAAAIIILSGALGLVYGQTPVKPSIVPGEVVSIGDKKIVVSTKNGPVDVVLTDKTVYKRVSAEKPDFQTATAAALSDISVGDKLTVTGILAPDGKSIPGRSVYLMTKADISQRHAKESEQWKTRGITGRVTAVNPQTNQMDVEMRSLMGSTKLTVTPKDNAKFLRYADNSIRYDEAKPSSIAEIKPGDMVRALGDRGSDGATFTAEEVITGAFQTIAGTVKSVDAEKKEVLIKNLQTGKDVTVLVGDASMLKRFPAEMAERMASFQTGGGGVRPVGQAGAAPAGGGGQSGGGGMGRSGFGGARGGGGIDDMLERFPSITAADLKPGDMIALSSTKNGNVDRIKAIKLLAGVEPFLRMAQATNAGQRNQGVQGAFTIPGLDGVGF
jgi:transcription antitermination factor NusG